MFKYLVKPSGRLMTTLSGKHTPDTQEALGSLQYLKTNTKQIRSQTKFLSHNLLQDVQSQ